MGTINKMNIDNCDLMDNLVPLWEEKNLTERERVLTYVCVVLNERCQNLSQRVSELEKLYKSNSNEQSRQTPRGLIGLNISGTQIGGLSREKLSNVIETPRKNTNNIQSHSQIGSNSGINNFYSKGTNTGNPYLKEEHNRENHHRRSHSKKSSKKNIHDIKKSIKDVKRTLDELKKSSKKN